MILPKLSSFCLCHSLLLSYTTCYMAILLLTLPWPLQSLFIVIQPMGYLLFHDMAVCNSSNSLTQEYSICQSFSCTVQPTNPDWLLGMMHHCCGGLPIVAIASQSKTCIIIHNLSATMMGLIPMTRFISSMMSVSQCQCQ